MPEDDARNPFALFWGLGYRRLVPIVPPDAELSSTSSLSRRPGSRGKAVGLKGSNGWYGFNWHVTTTTEEDLERWAAMGAGVGIRTGEGLVALDIDSLSDVWARRVTALAHEMLGPAPRRLGRAPKALLPYRVRPEDIDAVGYRVVLFDDGTAFDPAKRPRVELLSTGRQFVCEGTHPDTGQPYGWPEGVPAHDELTEVSAEQVNAFFAALAAMLPDANAPRAGSLVTDRRLVDQDRLRGDARAIAEAIARIPNDVPDYDGYRNMATALRGALPDDPETGLDIFRTWSERWEDGKPDPDFDERTFRSVQPPFALGAPYLYAVASRCAGEVLTPPELFFAPIADGEEPDTSAFLAAAAEALAATGRTAGPISFVPFDDAAASALADPGRPLIKGLIDWGAMTILYGESNVGKTFVSLDMAYAVASGRRWGGMKTTRTGVVYVAAEGGRGARRRALALQRKYGPCDGFVFLLAPIDLLRPDADLHPLIQAVAGLGFEVGLIVIDTLSRALAGGDENASTDMGAVVRHLDVLRSKTQAHVLVVHHSGKDKAKGARGHSLLRAATDTEIEVGDGQIMATKQRDLDKAWASPFALEVVELGSDEDGDPITSCTVKLVARAAEAPPANATPREIEVLQAVRVWVDTASPEEAGRGATVDEIADHLKGVQDADSVRSNLRRMAGKNLVKRAGRGRWLANDKLSEAEFFAPIADKVSVFD